MIKQVKCLFDDMQRHACLFTGILSEKYYSLSNKVAKTWVIIGKSSCINNCKQSEEKLFFS